MGRSLLTDRSSRTFSAACQLQGLPADFLSSTPFTCRGKRLLVGNGVPMAMGRAVAKAVRRAVEGEKDERA
jgi:DNA (cytosine-5)-methyltransferase 1